MKIYIKVENGWSFMKKYELRHMMTHIRDSEIDL